MKGYVEGGSAMSANGGIVRNFGRSALVSLLTVLAVLTVTMPTSHSVVRSIRSAVTLTATALYMGGTGHPLTVPPDTPDYIDDYVSWASGFVIPSGLCTGGNPGCAEVAVYTPAEFWPVTGLRSMRFDASVPIGLANLERCLSGAECTVTDPPFTSTVSRELTDSAYTVFAYSQSGTIATLMKSDLIAHPPAGTVSFVFESNPNRPNGGILERFVGVHIPILGVTFNGATVTNSPQPTPLTTVDIVHQYDPVADFPTNPLNALALINTLLGFAYEHPEEGAGTPVLQGQYQDSTYYLVPTDILPLLQPLTIIPYLGPLAATVLDPPLRVLVETGYNRTTNPGAPTPAKFLYFPNPIKTAVNFLKAIPNGWDNGIAYITKDPSRRPFHTTPQGPYGVGGPPVNAGAIDPYGPPTPAAVPPAVVNSTGTTQATQAAQARPARSRAAAARPSTKHPRPAAAGHPRRPAAVSRTAA